MKGTEKETILIYRKQKAKKEKENQPLPPYQRMTRLELQQWRTEAIEHLRHMQQLQKKNKPRLY